ncbi:MAG TPA: Ig domain-containing protein [Solirubrobacter sp.]
MSVLAVCLLVLAAVPAAARAASPVCTPATCTEHGQSRSIVLKRSGAAKTKKVSAKAARAAGKRTSLRVSVKFAPQGSKPRVTVTGPRGFKRVISKSTSFRKVRPGRYLIVADPIPGTDVTTFATYHRTRAKLRKGIPGWVGVRFMQRVESRTRVAEPSAIETVTGDPESVRDVVVDDPQALVQPGTVLAAGVGPQTPGGLLVAVESVTRDGDKTIARGGPAPLTAIGPQAEIESTPKLSMTKEEFQQALDAGSGGAAARSFKRTLPSFDGKPHAFAAGKKTKGFESPLECSSGATASFDGDVNFDAGTSVGIAWGGFWHPLTIQAHVGVDLHQDATMMVSIEGEAKCELELDLLPKDYRFTPWTFTVGPVPVVIVPKLNFQVTGEASVGAKIETYVEQSLDTSFGVQWDGSRFGPYGKASASFKTYKPNPSGTLNVKAAVGPKLSFDFYDIAGPYLTADLFLQLKADTAKDPWWRLSGGLQAGGGLRFKVWKFDFDKGIRDIWSEDWTIAKADKPPVPAFTTKTLPDADTGKAYSSKVAATTSRGPLSYSVNAGRLPDGLKLDPSSGAITGTAKGYGTREFEVAAKDSLGQKGLRSFSILTKTPPAVLKTTSLAAATVSVPYRVALEADGAVAPYRWDVTAGTLPAGVRLTAAGVLEGTPATIGAGTFTVRVRGLDDHAATRSFTLTVNPAPLEVVTRSLATGKADTAYSQTLTATGGRAPYTWAATAIPAGLALDGTGTLAGTPTAASTAPLAVTVTDADGRTAAASIPLTIADVDPVTISTASLPQGMAGVAYDQALTAFGGRAPYTWSASNAPAGLSVTGGHIVGTPSAAGAVQLALTATDRDGRSANATLALEILPPGISITTASLPTAQKDEAYDVALTALGGAAPYTWSVDSGTLPAGLTLDPSTGHIAGTPTAVESQQVTIKVVSSDNATVTKSLTLTVANLTPTPLDDADCPTANFCIVVDRKAHAYTRTASTGWSAGVDMAGVPQSAMYQNRVSCASATYCIYLTNAGKAAKWDGTSWTRLTDLPTGASYWDIDCVSSTNCVVAGGRNSGGSYGFVITWDGTSWSSEIGHMTNTNGFTRVVCPTADDCMLSGPGRAARFDGTTITMLPNLAAGGRTLECISMTECFTGSYADTSMKWDGTVWTASNPTSGADTLRYSPIGCAPTGTFCAAGGDYGTGNEYLWTYDGSTWTKGPVTEMKNTEVACGGPSLCVAVMLTGAARTWDGTSWTLSSVFARN